MVQFVDRRLNPKDKNLGNRRRFVRRVRSAVKKAVDDSVRRRGIADIAQEEKVVIPMDGIEEPSFRHAREGGRRRQVFTGNKTFRTGDELKKPATGRGRGRSGSADGVGEDEFLFVLSRDEFLDLFFDDLELPDMVKLSLKETENRKFERAGYSATGAPANISVRRTMRNAFGRRMALKRPKDSDTLELQQQIFAIEAIAAPTEDERQRLAELRTQLAIALRRQRAIPYIDPLDVRYNYFEARPKPTSRAVMFCLMDVSASMGEREKDLAKRFFVLLHLFLSRRYDRIDLIFIRHTHEAQEVDEETFFNSRETGGTVVSSALDEMRRIIAERYRPSEWNIYAAQASDGENFRGDSLRCAELLDGELMRQCQYFAYIEIIEEGEALLLSDEDRGMELWRMYSRVSENWPNFAMKKIGRPADIYPVFRELFSRQKGAVGNA